MISFIKGFVSDIFQDELILECNNIGYQIKVSDKTAEQLGGIQDEVKVYTYFHVREDAVQLFGFVTKDEHDLFKKLITVNGVGPKVALGILSYFTVQELQMAIIAHDSKAISKAPGIGGKTAERIIIDLKDKIQPEDVLRSSYDTGNVSVNANQNDNQTEAMQALIALGYSPTESMKAIQKCAVTADMSTEDILKEALKKLAF